MRLYSFVNGLYLNDKQHGIQTAHLVSELSLLKNKLYKKWAKDHKTIIILDAKNYQGLNAAEKDFTYAIERYNAITKSDDKIPYASFNEDQQSLGGIKTCFGFIVPEKIYARECFIKFTQDYTRFNHIESLKGSELLRNQDDDESLIYHMIKCYNLV